MLFIGLTTTFAILYSVGIVISLVGTGFLVGFLRQMRLMFEPVRVVATAVLFAALAMVWWVEEGACEADLSLSLAKPLKYFILLKPRVSAFVLHIAVLALIFVIILYLAYIWVSDHCRQLEQKGILTFNYFFAVHTFIHTSAFLWESVLHKSARNWQQYYPFDSTLEI
jgi:hypothetical protein